MHSQGYLDLQKQRILDRIRRCVNVINDPSRLDVSLKADKVLPSQQRALALMEAGHYGICVGCGDPISPERLKYVPAALRCVSCQKEAEK